MPPATLTRTRLAVLQEAACKRQITVAEVTGSNVVRCNCPQSQAEVLAHCGFRVRGCSVAEHVVMQILALVRNYIPAYKQVRRRG